MGEKAAAKEKKRRLAELKELEAELEADYVSDDELPKDFQQAAARDKRRIEELQELEEELEGDYNSDDGLWMLPEAFAMALTSDGEVEYDSVLHSYYSSKPHSPLLLFDFRIYDTTNSNPIL